MTDDNKQPAASDLSVSAGSRWVWVEREFSAREVYDQDFVGWIMEHVKMNPFTMKLNLRDEEVVRTTTRHDGGMKIEIHFENIESGDAAK